MVVLPGKIGNKRTTNEAGLNRAEIRS